MGAAPKLNQQRENETKAERFIVDIFREKIEKVLNDNILLYELNSKQFSKISNLQQEIIDLENNQEKSSKKIEELKEEADFLEKVNEKRTSSFTDKIAKLENIKNKEIEELKILLEQKREIYKYTLKEANFINNANEQKIAKLNSDKINLENESKFFEKENERKIIKLEELKEEADFLEKVNEKRISLFTDKVTGLQSEITNLQNNDKQHLETISLQREIINLQKQLINSGRNKLENTLLQETHKQTTKPKQISIPNITANKPSSIPSTSTNTANTPIVRPPVSQASKTLEQNQAPATQPTAPEQNQKTTQEITQKQKSTSEQTPKQILTTTPEQIANPILDKQKLIKDFNRRCSKIKNINKQQKNLLLNNSISLIENSITSNKLDAKKTLNELFQFLNNPSEYIKTNDFNKTKDIDNVQNYKSTTDLSIFINLFIDKYLNKENINISNYILEKEEEINEEIKSLYDTNYITESIKFLYTSGLKSTLFSSKDSIKETKNISKKTLKQLSKSNINIKEWIELIKDDDDKLTDNTINQKIIPKLINFLEDSINSPFTREKNDIIQIIHKLKKYQKEEIINNIKQNTSNEKILTEYFNANQKLNKENTINKKNITRNKITSIIKEKANFGIIGSALVGSAFAISASTPLFPLVAGGLGIKYLLKKYTNILKGNWTQHPAIKLTTLGIYGATILANPIFGSILFGSKAIKVGAKWIYNINKNKK